MCIRWTLLCTTDALIHIASNACCSGWTVFDDDDVGSTGSAMNDLFELNFHSSEQELTHGNNGPEEGEGPTAPTQNSMANSAKWRQIPPVNGGMAVHRFCHVGAIYKGKGVVCALHICFLRSEIILI